MLQKTILDFESCQETVISQDILYLKRVATVAYKCKAQHN